jgi:hypothetical protein
MALNNQKYNDDNIPTIINSNSNYIYDSYYRTKKSIIKIKFTCKKHKLQGVQEQFLSDFLKGNCGCKYCNGYKDTDMFKDELKKILPDIEVLGEYIKARARIKVRCKKHNYIWEPYAYNLLSGYGCKYCGKERTADNKRTIREQLKNNLPSNIEMITDYKDINNYKDKALFKCKKCGEEWTATVSNLVKKNNKTGCPHCANIRVPNLQRKTHLEFLKELKKINPNAKIKSFYHSYHENVKCSCRKHPECEWEQSPQTLLNGSFSCPKCTTFAHEQILLDFLDKHKIQYTPQKRFNDCKDKKPLPFDTYLDDYNICIEYDGEGHYIPIPWDGTDGTMQLKRTQLHDSIKDQYCKDNFIPLIRIPYWEQNNISLILTNELTKLNIPL